MKPNTSRLERTARRVTLDLERVRTAAPGPELEQTQAALRRSAPRFKSTLDQSYAEFIRSYRSILDTMCSTLPGAVRASKLLEAVLGPDRVPGARAFRAIRIPDPKREGEYLFNGEEVAEMCERDPDYQEQLASLKQLEELRESLVAYADGG